MPLSALLKLRPKRARGVRMSKAGYVNQNVYCVSKTKKLELNKLRPAELVKSVLSEYSYRSSTDTE